MATSVKVLKTVAVIREGTPGSYTAPNCLLPYTTFTVKQQFEVIEDASILGIVFPDLPLQGVRKVNGNIAGEVDVLTIAPLLVAACGDTSSPYDFSVTGNAEALSVVAKDAVKTYKYSGVYINNFTLSSTAQQKVLFSADVLGWKAETRDDTAWPTISVVPGIKLVHHHAKGTGYIYIGDQADALASGDLVSLEEWSLGINWGFADQFDNTDQGTLQHIFSGGAVPKANFTFKLSRHTSDSWLVWRDAHTALQAEIYLYASATAALKIQIPNFVIPEASTSEDAILRVPITANVARNGISTSYSNANMAFNSPIRFTLTNS